MKKRLVSSIIAAILSLSCFCSCGNDKPQNDQQEMTTTKTTTEESSFTAPTVPHVPELKLKSELIPTETTTTQKRTTTTTTKKTTTISKTTTRAKKKKSKTAKVKKPVDDKVYAGYAEIINTAESRKPGVFAICYFVYDYDKDGIEELVLHYLTGARIGEAETYEYDKNTGEPVLEAKGYCGSGIGYSAKKKSLMSSSVSNGAPLDKYPSGACVIILKLTVKNGEITYHAIADTEMNNPSESAEYFSDMQIDSADKAVTSSTVKANAEHNRKI